jgi:hypothetical protein
LHMTPRNLSLARLSCRLWFPFPPVSLSLRSIHCIATDSDNHIYTPRPVSSKPGNRGPNFSLFVCVFRGNRGPFSSHLLVSSCSLVSLAVHFDTSHRHSTSPTANPCVPSHPSSAYHPALDRRAVIRPQQWG